MMSPSGGTGELTAAAGAAPKAATRDPIPPPDELVARAEALRPFLREEQAATEERGRPSRETHEKLVAAGFYKMFIPRKYGGYEYTLHDFSRVIVALAQGCPSTAWFFAFGAGHSITLGSFYSEEVQNEAFASGHFQAPHSGRAEQATVRPTDGGWIVNGFWPYCSGVPYGTHFMGTAKILNADGTPAEGSPPRTLVVLVPEGGYEMLEDWGATLGMRGTGSNSVRVEDTFIPTGYATEWTPTDENHRTPGVEQHGSALYLGRWKPGYSNESQSVLIGAAKAALESYEDILKTRRLVRPGVISDKMRYMEVGHQRNFGHAMVTIACAEALIQRAGQMHHEHGERFLREGITYTNEDEELVTHVVRQAGTVATDAMDLIFAAAGSAAAVDGHPIQRYFRDVSTIKTHASSQFLDNVPSLARLHFGITEAPRAPSGG